MHDKKIVVFFFSLSVLFICACTATMTLEEAKKTAVSIGGQTSDMPHRRINDIVAMLDQPGHFDSKVVNVLRKKAEGKLPPAAVSADYYNRGQAAWELGRYQQGIIDLREAVELDRKEPSHNYMPYLYLCLAERKFGNFQTAVQLCEDALTVSNEKTTGTLYSLAVMYAMLGKMDKAADMQNRLNNLCARRSKDPQNEVLCNFRKLSLDAFLLEFNAQTAKAESLLIDRIDLAKRLIDEYPSIMVETKMDLAENLIRQKQFNAAEMQIRQALQENLALAGVNSPLTAEILRIFGNIYIAQGRIDDAKKITARAISIGHSLDSSQRSIFAYRARAQAGDLLAMQGSFDEALKQYKIAKDGLRNYQYQHDQYISRNPFYMLSLIKTGNEMMATKAVESALEEAKKKQGRDYSQAIDRALLGMIKKRQKNFPIAFHEFFDSLPVLEGKQTNALDYAKTRLLGFIIDDYIDLLAQIKVAGRENELGIDAADEAFISAEIARRNSIQGDIAASSVRSAATSPALAELVRKEQDVEKTIDILQTNLSDLLAAPADEVVEKGIKTINERMHRLLEARSVIREEIKKSYPGYDNFINPATPSLATARTYLRKGEALISIHSTEEKTYIWAIPYKGEVQFAVSPIGNAELRHIVSELRKSLDCNPLEIGDIPEFNAKLSYELYSRLLKPVENVWKKNIQDLLFVPSTAIGQLPLSILLTEQAPSGTDRTVLFDKYKRYPWLIKKTSVAIVPSVSSLAMLRNAIKKDEIARKAFIGFGDPIFTREQLANLVGKKKQVVLARRGILSVRGVRMMDNGSLDNDRMESVGLDALNRLPDTAEELKNIARTLNADQDEDVLLGIEATKTNVMTMNLRNRKVIAFATHALVPGDLDGLRQPALAFSPSAVTGKPNDNGLLTAEDILRLNLDADWVVLSACNTAAAGGTGADALTGLCRAFFYAGTKAVLATMYPVETTSARKLVTNIFENQTDASDISRARALQKSMLNLLENENLVAMPSGRIAASYAHPFFWAPFIIVGESGIAQQ